MKKIIYSDYTKIIAVILFIVCITAAVVIPSLEFANCCDDGEFVYRFEKSFSESDYLKSYLVNPEYVLVDTYREFYMTKDCVNDNEHDEEYEDTMMNRPPETTTGTTTAETTDLKTFEERLEYQLSTLYGKDKINYYIKINDKVYTNCGVSNGKELTDSEFYSYVYRNKNGDIVWDEKQESKSAPLESLNDYDNTSTIEICTSIKDEFVQECREKWEIQANAVNNIIAGAFIFGILAILMLVYLIGVCGRDKEGTVKNIWVDKIWLEIHVALTGFVCIAAVGVYISVMEECYTGHFPYNMLGMIVGSVSTLAAGTFINSTLSVVRNIKNGNFVNSSIIIRIARRCLKIFVKAVKWVCSELKSFKNTVFYALSKKAGRFLIAGFVIYAMIIGFFGIIIGSGPKTFLCAVVLFGLAEYVMFYRSKDIDEIKKGVSEIRNYNAGYKIPEPKCEDLKELASNINDIGKSIDESVSAKMKAERMKTELITNVSHDLKTPLTSIINYTELLSKVEKLPEEARDYVKVISKKSERLKTLTQDLFDISKAQSGNEEIIFEKLDAELLINQAVAEFNNEIESSEIKFCITADKELYFPADSKKMSRVVSNLIGNILKYSMKNTRAFISATEKDDQIVLEFKNTSAYPLDFDAEEITGRFVRGDESRTTEGNGLGLAIAKSYTELCNGTLDIILDGDLFKAVIKFRKYK